MRVSGLAAALMMLAAGGAVAAPCAPGIAHLTRPDGSSIAIAVEVADDDETRARGLMYRTSLDERHGMLFIYPDAQPVAFWMRNTLIALDILFFDKTGRLAHVHAGAKPLDETPIPGAAVADPAPDRLMVLEIGGGEAARLDLDTGALLSHPRLDPAKAAAPCD